MKRLYEYYDSCVVCGRSKAHNSCKLCVSCATKKAWRRPEHKAKMSQIFSRPEYREKLSNACRRYYDKVGRKRLYDRCCGCGKAKPRTDRKRCLSCSSKKNWRRPGYRAKMIKAFCESFTPEVLAKCSNNSREMWRRADYRKKVTEAVRKARNAPGIKEKIDKAIRKACRRPEVIARRKEVMSRPDVRAKISKSVKEFMRNPEARECLSKTIRKKWRCSDYRSKTAKAIRKGQATPDAKERMHIANLEVWRRPGHRDKLSGPNASGWRGGISFEPYSTEWHNRLKDTIRQRDHCRCQECGARRNGKKLAIHHIDYDKKNCDPENLITLCSRCHAKTNAGDRPRWTRYYQSKIKSIYRRLSQKSVILEQQEASA